MANKTKLSYKEIALKTGLSLSTISRVFNKSQQVSEEKRNQLIAALSEMGVDVDSLDLAPLPRNNIIIFNVPSLKNPFYSPIIHSAIVSAKRNGYSLFVSEDPVSKESLSGFLSMLKKTKVAGVICANSIVPERLEAIKELVPTVTCCEASTTQDIPFVTIDDEAASENAVKYLLSLGRRRIAFINGPNDFKYARDRYKGYANALKAKDIEIDNSIICAVGADMDYDVAKAHAGRMLSGTNPPDAFFCSSDVLACAAIKAAFEAGLRVPDDVAVVGFDNIQTSQIMNPSLTTVCQPTEQLGSIAIELLMSVIKGDNAPIKSIYLGAELIVRESTATYR